MSGEASGPSTREHSPMRRVVGVMTVLFWGSVVLMTAWVGLGWVAAGVQGERSFLHLGAALLGLTMVTSAFLFWQELRANRQEFRAVRRESRAIPADEGDEWPPKAWLYATAFGLSFFVSWYLLPALFLS